MVVEGVVDGELVVVVDGEVLGLGEVGVVCVVLFVG